jgi:hypothetical protein
MKSMTNLLFTFQEGEADLTVVTYKALRITAVTSNWIAGSRSLPTQATQ